MKTERLSFAIARHFEPEPIAEDTELYLNTRQRKPHSGWWDIARHSGKPVDSVSSYYWRPLNYDSPQVAMRLLKALLEMGRVVSALGISDAAREGSFVHHRLDNFEESIAIAFCRAHNLETE